MNDKTEQKYQTEIHQLTPIGSLSAVIQEQLIRLSETIMIPAGNSLFEQGEYSERLFFLLSGEVDLFKDNQFIKRIAIETDGAKTAINTNRSFSAIAHSRVVLFMVDRVLLERLVILDSSEDRIDVADRADWTDQLLSSEVMARLPSENMHTLFDRFDEIIVKKDEQIITQNMLGQYFYIVHEGRCVVSKHNYDSGDIITLAELETGGYFGEEALLTDQKRSTSVSMLTEGRLMRLARQDYEELLKQPAEIGLDYSEAAAKVRDGAIWLDIRSQAEFLHSHIIKSQNVPLDQLKQETTRLSKEKTCVLYCDIGLRSPFVANVLITMGFEVFYLKGGIQQYSRGINMSETWVDELSEVLRENDTGDVEVLPEELELGSEVSVSMGEQIMAVDQRIRDLKSMFATENQLAREWIENEEPAEDLGILIEARKKMDHIDSISSATNPHEMAKREGDSELGLLRKQLEGAQSHIQKERERVNSGNENLEQKELTLKHVSDELEEIKSRLKVQESYELSRRESFEQQLATERTKMREQLTRFSTGLERQQSRSLEIEEIRQTAAVETKQIIQTFKVAHEKYRARQQKNIQMVRLQLKKQAMNIIEKARKSQVEKAQALASLRHVQKQLNDLRGQRALVLDDERPSDVPLLVNVESMSKEIEKTKDTFLAADEEFLAKSESRNNQELLEQVGHNENNVRSRLREWFTSNEQFNLDRDNLTPEQKIKLERVKKIAHEALEEAFNGNRSRPGSSGDQFFKNYK